MSECSTSSPASASTSPSGGLRCRIASTEPTPLAARWSRVVVFLAVAVLLLLVASCSPDDDGGQAIEADDEEAQETDDEESDRDEESDDDDDELTFGDDSDDASDDDDEEEEADDADDDDTDDEDDGEADDDADDDDQEEEEDEEEEETPDYQRIRLESSWLELKEVLGHSDRMVLPLKNWGSQRARLTMTSDQSGTMTVSTAANGPGTECRSNDDGSQIDFEFNLPDQVGVGCVATVTFAPVGQYAETVVQIEFLTESTPRNWNAYITPVRDGCFGPGEEVGKLYIEGFRFHGVGNSDRRLTSSIDSLEDPAIFSLRVADNATPGGRSVMLITLPTDSTIYSGTGPSPSVEICDAGDSDESDTTSTTDPATTSTTDGSDESSTTSAADPATTSTTGS